jgi:hypothetical protein
LIGKAMELYMNGQLTQSELLPICQALAELQQQMQQAQNELKQIQASLPQQGQPQLQGPGTAPPTGATMPYPAPGETATGPYPPSPDYQSYVDAGPITAPPPPPGAESFAASEMETMMAPPPPPPPMSMPPVPPVPSPAPASAPMGVNVPRYCPVCQAELNPGHSFCHNCGTLVQNNFSSHMPTMRASGETPFVAEGQETMRANAPADISGQETMRASGNATPPPAEENKGV